MSFMNDMLSTGTYGESDRLDVTIRELDTLQARFDALLALLGEKGLLTAEERAKFQPEPHNPVTTEELDRLDVRLP